MEREIRYPFTASKVRELKVGDRIKISGPLVTARCRVHKHLLDTEESPVPLENGCVYHCSPIIVRESGQWRIRAAGPSASIAVDTYVPDVIEGYGVRLIVGMGALGEATRKACKRLGCVYAQVACGTSSKLAQCIQHVEDVHFLKEFGAADAMWELVAEGLEAVVTIDARGGSLHRRVKMASRRALENLY